MFNAIKQLHKTYMILKPDKKVVLINKVEYHDEMKQLSSNKAKF